MGRRVKENPSAPATVRQSAVDLAGTLAQSRSANTYRVAVTLLFLHWKANGEPIKLANGVLAMDGVGRTAKGRALAELERFELITIKRRERKSPIITLIV
jgi:hypothetical protein